MKKNKERLQRDEREQSRRGQTADKKSARDEKRGGDPRNEQRGGGRDVKLQWRQSDDRGEKRE